MLLFHPGFLFSYLRRPPVKLSECDVTTTYTLFNDNMSKSAKVKINWPKELPDLPNEYFAVPPKKKKTIQTRKGSLAESVVNLIIGSAINIVVTQLAVWASAHWYHNSWFTWDVNLKANLVMTAIFTLISVTRSYLVRRAFNHHHEKQL